MGQTIRLGIDVACRADHQVSCADGAGEFLWSGWRFRTTAADLERLWAKVPADAEVTVILEPTRNAWVPLAAWLQMRGAKVVMVPPEQSSDLRDYYNKHTKTDRLDSRILARLPLLHPDGLRPIDHLGPAQPLLRAVRLRTALVKRRTATAQHLDTLLELLGPSWAEALGSGEYNKSALAVLERYGDPLALKKLGRKRLAGLLIRASRGAWREAKADELLDAAEESIELWAGGGLDFEELAADIASEVRLLRHFNSEIAAMEERIEALYDEADPSGIVVSTPGIGVTLAAGILGRLGNPNRFANLAGVRSFTGLVPKIDQSGLGNRHVGLTKAGDPGLREALFMAADLARKVDPTLAARYRRLFVDEGRHHVSAVCTLAAVLATRIAACWRKGETYVLRDLDGNPITEAEGRAICARDFKISPALRQARRSGTKAKRLKGAGRGRKESAEAAPASSPPAPDATRVEAVA